MKSSTQYATSGIQGYIRNTKTGQMLRFEFPQGVMSIPVTAQIGEHHVEGQLQLSHIEVAPGHNVDMQITLKIPGKSQGVLETEPKADPIAEPSRTAVDGMSIPDSSPDARRGPNENIQSGVGVDGHKLEELEPAAKTEENANPVEGRVAWPKAPTSAVETTSTFPTRPSSTLQADGTVVKDDEKKSAGGNPKAATPADKKDSRK